MVYSPQGPPLSWLLLVSEGSTDIFPTRGWAMPTTSSCAHPKDRGGRQPDSRTRALTSRALGVVFKGNFNNMGFACVLSLTLKRHLVPPPSLFHPFSWAPRRRPWRQDHQLRGGAGAGPALGVRGAPATLSMWGCSGLQVTCPCGVCILDDTEELITGATSNAQTPVSHADNPSKALRHPHSKI